LFLSLFFDTIKHVKQFFSVFYIIEDSMKVIIDAVGIRGHGGASVLFELLYWLPRIRQGWQWHVFLLERRFREFDDPLVLPSVTIEETRHGNSGLSRLCWVYGILPHKIKALNADVLFSFSNIGSFHPPLPQITYCHQQIAFSPEEVASFLNRMRMRFLRYCILQGAKGSYAVIVQTDMMRKRLLKLDSGLAGRVYIIPCGYRAPSTNPIVRSQKRKLIDGASRPRLIYVSYPSEHKNHANLVLALHEIVKFFPEVSLLLTLERTNPPNLRYGRFIHEIIKIARSVGIEERLIWLGQLNPDEVAYLFTHSDLHVFPSLAESLGLALVEALAAGCPIAASDLPYAHDVAGNAAVYFNPFDPKAIARTVVSILGDPKTLANLKATGADRKSQFSYEKSAKLLADIIEMAWARPSLTTSEIK
jgi:glycosyltransferase involved in cell wall biosynthesis